MVVDHVGSCRIPSGQVSVKWPGPLNSPPLPRAAEEAPGRASRSGPSTRCAARCAASAGAFPNHGRLLCLLGRDALRILRSHLGFLFILGVKNALNILHNLDCGGVRGHPRLQRRAEDLNVSQLPEVVVALAFQAIEGASKIVQLLLLQTDLGIQILNDPLRHDLATTPGERPDRLRRRRPGRRKWRRWRCAARHSRCRAPNLALSGCRRGSGPEVLLLHVALTDGSCAHPTN
mmetsp:Transcript_90697/g.194520  ORF Transcript_90697/g.194520 Transcript_90697/m.194520 type:complete len:233 (-) Transcript_90697:558-1256(-)